MAKKGSVDGHAIVMLERGQKQETLSAHFSRAAARMRVGRRRVSGGTGAAHDEEHFRVALPGPGPLVAKLTSIEGGVGTKVHLALRAENGLWNSILPPLALAFALLVSFVEWRAGEAKRATVAGCAAALGVVTLYLPTHLARHDLFGSLLGSAFVALIGGVVAAGMFTVLVRRRVAE